MRIGLLLCRGCHVSSESAICETGEGLQKPLSFQVPRYRAFALHREALCLGTRLTPRVVKKAHAGQARVCSDLSETKMRPKTARGVDGRARPRGPSVRIALCLKKAQILTYRETIHALRHELA